MVNPLIRRWGGRRSPCRAPTGRLAAALLSSLIIPANLAHAQGGSAEPDIVVTPTRTPEPARTIGSAVTVIPREEIEKASARDVGRSLPPRPRRDAHPERRPGPRPDRAHPRRRRAPHPGDDRRHPGQRPDLDRARVRLLDARPRRHRAHRGAARAAKRALRLRRHGRRHQHHHQARQRPARRPPLGRGRPLRHQGDEGRHLRRRRAGRLLLRLRRLRHGRLLDLRLSHPPPALRACPGGSSRTAPSASGSTAGSASTSRTACGWSSAAARASTEPSSTASSIRPSRPIPTRPRGRRAGCTTSTAASSPTPGRCAAPRRSTRTAPTALSQNVSFGEFGVFCGSPSSRSGGHDLPAGHLLHRRPQGRRVPGRPQARALRPLHLRRQGRAGPGRQLLADRAADAAPRLRDIAAEQTTRSAFAQHQITLFDRLHLTFGGRIDDVLGVAQFETWRTTAAYDLRETGTKLRASAGTGAKAPSLFQLHSPDFGTATLQPRAQSSASTPASTRCCLRRPGEALGHAVLEPLPQPDRLPQPRFLGLPGGPDRLPARTRSSAATSTSRAPAPRAPSLRRSSAVVPRFLRLASPTRRCEAVDLATQAKLARRPGQ